MIYALNDQDEKINASMAVKGERYYCPNLDCVNRELILKKGQIRITHFAHKSLKDCSYEPESEAHILCKTYIQALLYLDKQFIEYYGIEGVRPDVLYDQFALEIQCSPITVKEVKRRNKIYKENGYIPIWIFLEEGFISSKKRKESKSYYRIKKSALYGSYKNIGRGKFHVFSFKCDNENIYISFSYYDGFFEEFMKHDELVINSKDDFDYTLKEIVMLIEIRKELNELKKKLNSLPKKIQGYLYESTNLDIPHISASDFGDGVNNFNIGMFLDDIFLKEASPMDIFKERLENMLIEACTKEKKIEEWRDRNTFEKDGKKYIPLCGINKIYHETTRGYRVWDNQWVPKSRSFKDKKYLYCEEWVYNRIVNDYKKK